MLEEGFLERWESASVKLDENGESEAYFPVWGFADPDVYLARSDRLRAELAAKEAEAAALTQAEESAEEEFLAEGAMAPAETLAAPVEAREPAAVTSAPARVAWGALYGLKRVLLILLVCAVGSLLVTMAMNPEMTFFDVVDLFVSKGAGVIARICGE